jgi:hypothetical protein
MGTVPVAINCTKTCPLVGPPAKTSSGGIAVLGVNGFVHVLCDFNCSRGYSQAVFQSNDGVAISQLNLHRVPNSCNDPAKGDDTFAANTSEPFGRVGDLLEDQLERRPTHLSCKSNTTGCTKEKWYAHMNDMPSNDELLPRILRE